MIYLFDIGFLSIRIWDVLDILIVGYLIYQIYILLRGSIAFNIFIGVVLLYALWWLVGALKMDLLSTVLGQFVSIGVLMLIIIFQPEVRRFLLLLGNSTLRQRSNFLGRLLDKQFVPTEKNQLFVIAIQKAILVMSKEKTGALIVVSNNDTLQHISDTGVKLDAQISQPLLESIFNKESPLHDGAVIITNRKIAAASCILPVSDTSNLPTSIGLRHRSGIGVTENADVAAFIVSEETGNIAYAYKGKLSSKLNETKLHELLKKHLNQELSS